MSFVRLIVLVLGGTLALFSMPLFALSVLGFMGVLADTSDHENRQAGALLIAMGLGCLGLGIIMSTLALRGVVNRKGVDSDP